MSCIYVEVYFTDLCMLISGPEPVLNSSSEPGNCYNITGSSLMGGYRVFSSYLSHYQEADAKQLREANEEYGSEALLLMLGEWMGEMNGKVKQAKSVCEIVFYVFLFVGVLGFLVCWLLYLSKINTEINEAIRMLNMIPFKLLSNARKETRDFIVWIIREANIKNHKLK